MRARLLSLIPLIVLSIAVPALGQDAHSLRARHAALRAELADNPFGRPVHVESSEEGGQHEGTVYAVLEQPFNRVSTALRSASQWCDVLILQANVKHCEAPNGGEALSLFVGRKAADSLEQTYRTDFSFNVDDASAEYLRVALDAPEGPLGTTDYRIRFEATPLDANRSFLHLRYSYGLRSAARIGMNLYLATSGRDKVGFSIVERSADGRPVYVGGVQGVVERNTMRYYLALEAYLGTLDAPAPQRADRRLRVFHAGLERYPRQLREHDLAEYLAIKRRDVSRVAQARHP